MDFTSWFKPSRRLNTEDAFRARLKAEEWRTIGPYLTQHDIRAGDLLIKQGDQ